ncbi:hypothetical protein PHET_04175 [Paragonimus heterotremus]|uniref:EF-hand domain-containing protein n=1 Tax=Paragonimus heterotremus TaxID=100268 RepID=A0A8J4WIS8_9TREM|nr:hypothetical protein PHET_04175 [Paragonimus heterotremus]
MSEHADEIISMLGANVKGFITFDDFLRCRKNVFFLENESRDAFFDSASYFGSRHSPTKKPSTLHACTTCRKGFHDSTFIQKPNAQDDKYNVFGNNICKSQTVSNITSHEVCEPNRFQSSASENSLVNSGADYDSGAQDLCDEPQSLHLLLRCEYPDLYRLVFPPLPTQSPDQLPPRAGSRPAQPVAPFGSEPTGPVASSTRICQRNGLDDRASEPPPPLTVESVTTGAGTAASDLPTTVCADWVRRLFDVANRLHAQHTAHLRSEVQDLTHRLKNGQTSWEMSHREAQRLQRERDQLHNELTNQCARYEDRLTELHSVIAELHRRLKHAGTGVANKMEKVNEEVDECTNQPFSTSSETRKTDKGTVCDASSNRPDIISDGSSDIDDEDVDGNSVDAVDGDHLEVRSDQNLAPNRMKDDLDISKASPVLSTLLYDVLNRSNKHLLDFSIGAPKMEMNIDGSPRPESNTNHWTMAGDETASKRYCSPVEYETALARLQAQLACITEERDQLARQLSTSVAPTANTTMCEAVKDTLCSSTADSLPTPVVDRQIRTPTTHPVMGLGRQLPLKQTQSGDQVPASCVNASITSVNMNSMTPTTVESCLPNTCSEPITSATSAEGNIYDQPEPAWLIAVLDDYCHSIPIPDRQLADPICSPSLHPDHHPLHHTDQLDREALGVTNTFLWPPQMIDDPVLSGPLSPHALLQFLTTLSRLAPYPRLADVTHRAQLTWSRLLATLARLQADCLVLQANLAEVKTTADRMQCQLNQIEASLSASLRAACLADACLEISDCMNQLYSTELAIILYSRQNQKTLFSGGAFSTLSSSTTSSCSPIPGLPNKVPPLSHPCQPTLNTTLTTPVQPSGAPQQQQQQQQQHSRPTSSPSTTPYPPLYAVYAVSGLMSGTENNEQQLTGRLQTAVSFEPSLRTFKAYRHQAELAGHAILDRYDMNEHNLDRLYPTTSSSNGVQPSSSSSGGFTRPHPLSPGFFPIQSPLGPTIPSTQSLTTTSLYANSWYVSLGRLGRHLPIANGGCQTEHLSAGSCAGSVSLLGQTKVPIFGPTCIPSKRIGTNTNHSATLPGTGGGWQTPDSGAGSSSTNEPASCLTAASSSGELNTYAALLDLLPSPWTMLTDHAHARAHSIYDSDSDSSDSSEGSSAAQVQKAVGFTATHPIDNSQHALHLSTWTRVEERKLRMLLNHLGQARRLLRSTIVDVTLLSSSPDEDTDLRRPCESTKTQELFTQGLNVS